MEHPQDKIMDYGERQERAEYLVQRLRLHPEAPMTVNPYIKGWPATQGAMANAIERMDQVGRDFVAVAGFVLFAMQQDSNIKPKV